MEESEKVLGSWDLEVGFFCYLVVYLEREELTDLGMQSFFPSRCQALFFENIV